MSAEPVPILRLADYLPPEQGRSKTGATCSAHAPQPCRGLAGADAERIVPGNIRPRKRRRWPLGVLPYGGEVR